MESQTFTSVQKESAIANVEMVRKRRMRTNGVLLQIYAYAPDHTLLAEGCVEPMKCPDPVDTDLVQGHLDQRVRSYYPANTKKVLLG